MMNKTPNPGSPEARKLGCKCPRCDNANGEGLGNGLFWINQSCPVHGGKSDENRD